MFKWTILSLFLINLRQSNMVGKRNNILDRFLGIKHNDLKIEEHFQNGLNQ